MAQFSSGRPGEGPDLPASDPEFPVPGDPVEPDVHPDPMPDPQPVPPQDPHQTPPARSSHQSMGDRG